jgi:hypothetical protein
VLLGSPAYNYLLRIRSSNPALATSSPKISIPRSFSVGTTGTVLVAVLVGVLVGVFGDVFVGVGVLVGVFVGVLVGPITVMLARPVLPVPPLSEAIWTLLFLTPAVVPTMFWTPNVHTAPAAIVIPDMLIVREPHGAVNVPPLHPEPEPVIPQGSDMTSPAGSVSVNATPVSVVFPLGFSKKKVKVVVPFSGIVEAPKALAIIGGDRTWA